MRDNYKVQITDAIPLSFRDKRPNYKHSCLIIRPLNSSITRLEDPPFKQTNNLNIRIFHTPKQKALLKLREGFERDGRLGDRSAPKVWRRVLNCDVWPQTSVHY